MTLVYRIARMMLTPIGWIGFRLSTVGKSRVPRRGGLLIIANHASHLDPVLLGCTCPRDLHFFARDTLFRPPWFAWLLRSLQAIPVSRGEGDRGALNRAKALLREGKVVAIFPEGTRSPDGRLGAAKAGVGIIAQAAGVPVIPVHIHGSHRALPRGKTFPKPTKIRLRWGEARSPEEWAQRGPEGARTARRITEALWAEMATLARQNSPE